MEQQLHENDRKRPKYLEKNVPHCNFFNHRSQTGLPSAMTPATNRLTNGTPSY
jgi:hypothetical protein